MVRHVAAPYPVGERFDLRYTFYGHRNHVVLLASTGHRAELRRYLPTAVRAMGAEVRDAGRRARLSQPAAACGRC